MSAKSSPSPWQGPTTEVDESQLPQGHCRYILLVPEIRGQRCACANFHLNKGLPGATCACGHLACYHKKDAEPTDVDMLKQRIQTLEDSLASEDRRAREREDDAYESVLGRVSGLEEDLERSKEEFHQEIKRAYSNSTPLWGAYQELKGKFDELEDNLRQANVRFAEVGSTLRRLDDRQLELQDADTYLEERIENIVETMEEEEYQHFSRGRGTRPRRRSTSDARRPSVPLGPLGVPLGVPLGSGPSDPRPTTQGFGGASAFVAPAFPPTSMAIRTGSSATTSGIWTVHISLMPHATIPMPFERNTNAYQRCLSRGLHQMVAVRGPTAEAFSDAISKAFDPLLKGRPWMPLQARLCDAAPLQGLPMLRQLEPHLIDTGYDAAFLQENCAVCDGNGMMDSLYITMREPYVLSWHALRHAPVVVEGLEESWEYDSLLDKEHYDDDVIVDDDDRPAAGDILPAFPSLKRAASEMARSNSFSSSAPAAAEGVASRTKRTCPLPANTMLNIRRPGVGTA